MQVWQVTLVTTSHTPLPSMPPSPPPWWPLPQAQGPPGAQAAGDGALQGAGSLAAGCMPGRASGAWAITNSAYDAEKPA